MELPTQPQSAAAFVLVHKLSAVDPAPSEVDFETTREHSPAEQFLKIEVMDHVTLGSPNVEIPKLAPPVERSNLENSPTTIFGDFDENDERFAGARQKSSVLRLGL